ncbi:peptide/nickel transport system permease protein [Tamaricihabitans halophyticus]|uniref:Peptide/nickel transport system permease protein n=1 Tax=Tamaricihabitans halophyticus TaxID=1262583 RepID=A0A4R2QKS7_9PSEU|nr:ABC transporter permease [Tamaricihabitans halophyticus]TCP49937.1 peptide/nickel transport system permease protein [Tamaricihabitans halophyticus]
MRLFSWWLRRALSAVVTLFLVSILIFTASRLMPGGFAEVVLGPLASPEQKAEVTAKYGLDESILVQYARWLGTALSGDFGISMISGEPVTTEFGLRLPVTAQLALFGIGGAILIGVPLGVATAVRAGRRRGGAAVGRLLSGLGVSVPEFVLGSVVVFLFSRFALGLTVGGYVPFGADPAGNLQSMLLPAAVLSVFVIAVTARTTRDAVLTVLVEPYITASIARGDRPAFIVCRHVLRNASIPIITVLSTVSAYLLGGAVIIEYLFNLPGMGTYLVQAVGRRDYAVVQAGVLLAAVVFIVLNMVTDAVAGVLDPRFGAAAKGRKQ